MGLRGPRTYGGSGGETPSPLRPPRRLPWLLLLLLLLWLLVLLLVPRLLLLLRLPFGLLSQFCCV